MGEKSSAPAPKGLLFTAERMESEDADCEAAKGSRGNPQSASPSPSEKPLCKTTKNKYLDKIY